MKRTFYRIALILFAIFVPLSSLFFANRDVNLAATTETTGQAKDAAHDWSTYNRDSRGWRYNSAETILNVDNVGGLVEKWRFPTKESGEQIGVIHATPSVVDGYVYFGTATGASFYKVSPEGELVWQYRNDRPTGLFAKVIQGALGDNKKLSFQSQEGGILTSALVHDGLVYFGDMKGRLVALDAETGELRWELNTQDDEFPDAVAGNLFFASPILADGKVIAGGGTLEQLIAGSPFYPGSRGRGFIVAVDPKTGELQWKFDVGEKPQRLNPPVTITDARGKYTWNYGPATSSVWSTPSYDEQSKTVFFGTDVNTAPRQPTEDNPDYATKESCAVFAVDVRTGKKKWSTQINPGDVWTNSMLAYDPKTGLYKDLSIGDTPKVYDIDVEGTPTRVVGVGCKNGAFYVLDVSDGTILHQTPVYDGPPTHPLKVEPNPRMLAFPSPIGGLQSGCATDGKRIFTNGIDALYLGTTVRGSDFRPPFGGKVVSLSGDTQTEFWRHNRPKIDEIGGPRPIPVFKDVGDPVASGVAVANGVIYFTTTASGKLVALDADQGTVLKEIDLGPVWCGPSVSRGRVYVGTGNTLFSVDPGEAWFPKKMTGELYSFGLPSPAVD